MSPFVTSVAAPRRQKIVQKYGGTSVGKFPVSIVEVVKSSLIENDVAVVCSARSSSTKAAGTTNRLLRAASLPESFKENKDESFESLINEVRADHIETAKQEIRNPEIREALIREIADECDLILRVLEAATVLGEVSPKSKDKIMGAGEKLSCRFMAALLRDHGIDAVYVDLSDIINFKVNHSLDQAFYDNVAKNLAHVLPDISKKVPVVTGFFGAIPRGLLNTVGRGYTDLCAALVAIGICADELQIWKEVDGIFTADPRKVPTAKLIPQITPAEAAELTFYGSEVIHPATMDQVIRARIPIRIKNVMNPRGPGTMVFPESNEVEHPPGKLFRTKSSAHVDQSRSTPKRPTAVTLKRNILIMNIHSHKRSMSHGFFAGIFGILDKWRLSVDVISTSEVNMSLALHSERPMYSGTCDTNYRIVDQDLQGAIEELKRYGTVDVNPRMAIVSLVGRQMKDLPGISGKMFTTLGENNINIEMISQGASEINITCVIREEDAHHALNALHTNLFTFLYN